MLLHPGPLSPSDLWVWVIVMAACVAFACVWSRGFMPAASVASGWHALPPGLFSGRPTVATSPCHTLPFVLVLVTDLSLGGLVCSWVQEVRAPGKFTSLCVIIGLQHCPAGLLAPPLLRQNGVSCWAMDGLLMGSAGIFLPCVLLRFLYFPWVFTVGVGGFLMSCTPVEVFWFVEFRPVGSSVVSTHSTRRFDVRQGPRVLPQGMRDGL